MPDVRIDGSAAGKDHCDEKDQRSGLVVAREILKDVEGIAFVDFNERDVVRHELVARIVRAHDRYEKK